MKPAYKCKHCKEKFPTVELLKKHTAVTHNDSITVYTCEVCQRQFQYKGSYTDHLKSHSKDDIRYECTECPCFFKNHGHLKSHIKDVHSTKTKVYNCKGCPKKFDSKALMTQHVRKAHASVQVIHKCTSCQRIYGSKNSLKWHVHINHNKDYVRSKCPYCPSDFKWPHHLKVHIKKAHIEKGHAPTDLLKKGLSTIRRKKNNCIVCDEKFDKKLDLMLHLRSVHKQELDIYKCCLCTAVFSLKNSLKFHLDEHRRKSTNPGNHRCNQCYPESNPILYKEEKTEVEEYDGRSEIEKEIIDFELTLMEDEDIRRLIRYRLKHAKKKQSPELEVVYRVVMEDSDDDVFDLFSNGNTDNISGDVSSENGADSVVSNNSSVKTKNSDDANGSVNKVVKICLERLTNNELTLKNGVAREKQCNTCKSKFKLQHSLNEHRKLCHKAEEPPTVTTDRAPEIPKPVSTEGEFEKVSPKPIEKINNVKIYKCKYCKEKFTKPIHLGRHVRSKHGNMQTTTQPIATHAQKYKHIGKIKHNKNPSTNNYKGNAKHKMSPNRKSKGSEKSKSGIAEVTDFDLKMETQKLYECGKCVLYFKSKLELLKHISDIHMGIQPRTSDSYFCDHCNSKFATKEQIEEHLKNH